MVDIKSTEEIEEQVKRETERKIESVVDILKKEVKKQPFILDKMIPENAITALTADVGKGKSLFALKIAQAIAEGTKLFDIYKTKKKKVLILDLEMSEYDITNRVHTVINKPTDISFHNQDFQIDSKDDYEWLVKVIKKNKFEMLIIDTLNSAHSKEENSASEMREVNRTLLNLIDKTNVTILYLHHHRKPQKGENYGQASSRGSTEILAKVASHLLLDSRKIMVVDKDGADFNGLHITITQYKARLTENLKSFGVDIWYNPFKKKTFWRYTGEFEEKKAKDIAKDFILTTIKENKEWSVNDLMEEKTKKGLNFGKNNLRDALKELTQTGILKNKTGKQNKKFYFLPSKNI
ncbi:AAA family ATPase [Candidatus Parcubacteria bacterium]|nr:AAA family ATPase [Candidatus Parcubacteria bacterium]